MYKVRIIYIDDSDVTVGLSSEEVEKFKFCIEKNKIYWNKQETLEGYWFNTENIKYMTFFKENNMEEINDSQETEETEEAKQTA